jgi:hypothetical protein
MALSLIAGVGAVGSGVYFIVSAPDLADTDNIRFVSIRESTRTRRLGYRVLGAFQAAVGIGIFVMAFR